MSYELCHELCVVANSATNSVLDVLCLRRLRVGRHRDICVRCAHDTECVTNSVLDILCLRKLRVGRHRDTMCVKSSYDPPSIYVYIISMYVYIIIISMYVYIAALVILCVVVHTRSSEYMCINHWYICIYHYQ